MYRMWLKRSGAVFCLPAILLLVLFVFLAALSNLSQGSSNAAAEQLETSLRKAAVTCYAADGIYPADLEDLEERCGIEINRKQYVVYYEIFASNRMPAITVLKNEN